MHHRQADEPTALPTLLSSLLSLVFGAWDTFNSPWTAYMCSSGGPGLSLPPLPCPSLAADTRGGVWGVDSMRRLSPAHPVGSARGIPRIHPRGLCGGSGGKGLVEPTADLGAMHARLENLDGLDGHLLAFRPGGLSRTRERSFSLGFPGAWLLRVACPCSPNLASGGRGTLQCLLPSPARVAAAAAIVCAQVKFTPKAAPAAGEGPRSSTGRSKDSSRAARD